MRILFANWSRRRVGGTETYLERVMPLLAARGHALACAYEVDEPAGRALIDLRPEWPALPLAGAGAIEAVRAWKPDVVGVHGLLDPEMERRLLDVAPAVLFGHSYYGTCISGDKTHRFPVVRPCGRRFAPACLALYFPRRCGGLNPLSMVTSYDRQRRRRALLDRYEAIVAPSEHMRREFLNHGAASGRVYTVPHGIEPLAGASAPAASRLRSEAGAAVRLMQIGRMDRLKGGRVLLDALSLAHAALGRSLQVTFIGDGPSRTAWEQRAREVSQARPGIAIEFTGWLGPGDLTPRLAGADVVVMPSLWPEPFGLAGLEANRLGIPVVAFAAGGIPQWLTDGVNGCLAADGAPAAEGLAAALVRCVRSLESSDDLAHGALSVARRHDLGRHADALIDVLTGAARRAARITA